MILKLTYLFPTIFILCLTLSYYIETNNVWRRDMWSSWNFWNTNPELTVSVVLIYYYWCAECSIYRASDLFSRSILKKLMIGSAHWNVFCLCDRRRGVVHRTFSLSPINQQVVSWALPSTSHRQNTFVYTSIGKGEIYIHIYILHHLSIYIAHWKQEWHYMKIYFKYFLQLIYKSLTKFN